MLIKYGLNLYNLLFCSLNFIKVNPMNHALEICQEEENSSRESRFPRYVGGVDRYSEGGLSGMGENRYCRFRHLSEKGFSLKYRIRLIQGAGLGAWHAAPRFLDKMAGSDADILTPKKISRTICLRTSPAAELRCMVCRPWRLLPAPAGADARGARSGEAARVRRCADPGEALPGHLLECFHRGAFPRIQPGRC